jgi:hypothetical protein
VPQDEFINNVIIYSNRDHKVVEYRTGFGFGQVTIQVLDGAGNVVYEESAGLDGTPDPDISFIPQVVGRTIVLTFTGHESPDCGGFSELKVELLR